MKERNAYERNAYERKKCVGIESGEPEYLCARDC